MNGITEHVVIAAVVVSVYFVEVSTVWDWCVDGTCKETGEDVKNTMCIYKSLPENDLYRGKCTTQNRKAAYFLNSNREHLELSQFYSHTVLSLDIKDAMTDTDRKRFLTWHNTYRNNIAAGKVPGWPPAADMRQVTWNKELEEVALRFSFQTKPGHDECRRTMTYEDVGQNSAMSWPGGEKEYYGDVNFSFIGWVDEFKNVRQKVNPKDLVEKYKQAPIGYEWGHLTAIVWATLFKIGCSTTTFEPKQPPVAGYESSGRQVACNLHPSSNWLKSPIYTIGDACSKCPTGTSCNSKSTHPFLCALPGDPADEVPEFIFLNSEMLAINHYCAVILLLMTQLF